MNNWFSRLIDKLHHKPKLIENGAQKKGIPEGIWVKCDSCGSVLYNPELARNLYVCTKCNHHWRMNARQRIAQFLDPENQIELASEIAPIDRLKFKDTKKYKDRLAAAQKDTGEQDALVAIKGTLCDIPVIATFFNFAFIGGSMGAVVGEKFVYAAETALLEKMPLINFSASGGARMQEGLISLMQMAKTSAALARLSKKGIPYISVLTNPTTGGVSASLAMLGDIIIAEPNATIGFAGQRVIEQTVRQQLPEGFQRSNFALEHGAIDMIVERKDLRQTIAKIIHLLGFSKS